MFLLPTFPHVSLTSPSPTSRTQQTLHPGIYFSLSYAIIHREGIFFNIYIYRLSSQTKYKKRSPRALSPLMHVFLCSVYRDYVLASIMHKSISYVYSYPNTCSTFSHVPLTQQTHNVSTQIYIH